jgi:hypothetical protein
MITPCASTTCVCPSLRFAQDLLAKVSRPTPSGDESVFLTLTHHQPELLLGHLSFIVLANFLLSITSVLAILKFTLVA